jgi:hypothetical protein
MDITDLDLEHCTLKDKSERSDETLEIKVFLTIFA